MRRADEGRAREGRAREVAHYGEEGGTWGRYGAERGLPDRVARPILTEFTELEYHSSPGLFHDDIPMAFASHGNEDLETFAVVEMPSKLFDDAYAARST